MGARRLTLLAVVGAVGACARGRATLPVDAGVAFAMHRRGDGFVVDRMREGGAGELVSPGWLSVADAPKLVLRSDGEVRAALWAVGRTRILVRAEASTRAPRTGEVLASWENGAIRLSLWTEGGRTLTTDTFRRSDDDRADHALLGRDADGGTAPAGTYRAALRDADGTDVGWVRARLRALPGVDRVYDAVLPPGVDDGLAAAAAVAIDAEIDWIEDHARAASAPSESRHATSAASAALQEEQRGDHHPEGDTRGEHADEHLGHAVRGAPDGAVRALGHVLHAVPVEHVDALLLAGPERVDPLLRVAGERRDRLLRRLARGPHDDGDREQDRQDDRAEPHADGA